MTVAPHRFAFISLLDTGRWGASEYLWSQTALRLSRDGHTITACIHGWTPRPSPLEDLRRAGIALIERSPPRGARLKRLLADFRRTASHIDAMHKRPIASIIQQRPDLVLLSCAWPTDPNLPAWAEALYAAGIPYAVLVHTHAGHNWPLGRAANRMASVFNRAAATYCVSEDNRALLLRQFDLKPQTLQVVRNPLGVDRATAPSWPAGPVARLACVGRLEPSQKGQDLLLECLQDPRWHDRAVSLGFFGDGPARSRLGQIASHLPAGLVTFHGHVEHPASIWESHHLLVFPSRFEGLGLVVAEAQLCGRPVVITDCAARELVLDGQTGFIAASATVPALQAALERAWLRRTDWPALGANARRHMLQLLPEDPVADFARTLLSRCAP